MNVDEARLRKAVLKGLRIKDQAYRADLKLGDLEEWDSLGHLELVAAVEGEFGVSFDVDDIPSIDSLQAIRDRLQAIK